MSKSKNVILIPALASTKDISRQNLRTIKNKPLIYYTLKTSLDSECGDVFVLTDSEEIQEVVLQYNGNVIKLPSSYSKTNDQKKIIEYALNQLMRKDHDYVNCVVLSPSLPLISHSTIKNFFSRITKEHTIFGYIKRCQTYKKLTTNSNLARLIKENDVVTIRDILGFNCEQFIKKKNFYLPHVGIELSNEEGILVKNYHDLDQIEKILKRKRILVRVDGSKKIGLGHVYNMLTILNHLRNDEILIVMNEKQNLGHQKFQEHYYDLKYFSNNSQLYEIINEFKPNIIFNDILNTSKQYMFKLRKFNSFVVNFEDIGPGSDFADLVFNPIYFSNKNKPRKFFGSDYACVRDEFRILQSKPLNKNVKSILITFGGTDPQNHTMPVLQLLSKINLKEEIIVILGMGNSHKKAIRNFVRKMNRNGQNVKVIQQSNIMAKYIRESDFVITANGRTVFEVASLKVPMITISTHEREESHSFSRISGGAIHLGSTNDISLDSFHNAISKMMDYNFRLELRSNLEKYDLLNGVHKIIRIINTKLEESDS